MRWGSQVRGGAVIRVIGRFLAWYIVGAIIAGMLLLFEAFPYHPKSKGGWLVFFLAALPIALAGEGIGVVLGLHSADRPGEQRSGGAVPWQAVGKLLMVFLVFIGVVAVGLLVWREAMS
jgi:hypothetical protein